MTETRLSVRNPIRSTRLLTGLMTWSVSTGILAATTTDWTVAAAMLCGSLAMALAIRQLVHPLTRRMRLQGYVTTVVSRIAETIVVLIGLAYALRQLDVEVGPLLGALGLGGLVVALSLQHVLRVLEEPIRNQTAEPYRRTTIPVQVGYEADLRQVQHLLTKSIRDIDGLGDSIPADVIVTSFDDSGATMTVRIRHPSEELSARWLVSETHIAIRETLSREGIEIPFPQRVVHLADSSDTHIDQDINKGEVAQP